jgi:hypothetical protein
MGTKSFSEQNRHSTNKNTATKDESVATEKYNPTKLRRQPGGRMQGNRKSLLIVYFFFSPTRTFTRDVHVYGPCVLLLCNKYSAYLFLKCGCGLRGCYPWRSDRIQHTVHRIWVDLLFADCGMRNNNKTAK